ncbi:MAG TPA: hypothetical protein VM901_01055 [Bdellovibrionota bacterium]|jgi:hypothetical protein|nr:hypothetical protein [Bdellovibrionota bacterium]
MGSETDLNREREIFDLRSPQKTLLRDQVPAPLMKDPGEVKTLEASLRRLLRHPQRPGEIVEFWASAEAALASFLAVRPNTVIATWTPTTTTLPAHAQVRTLSRDPADWNRDTFAQCDALLVPNPGTGDGYYLPEAILERALETVHALNPHLLIVIDQRQRVFCWEELAPGDANKMKIPNPYVVIDSTHPALGPERPELVWTWSNEAPSDASAVASPSPEALAGALYLISNFKTQQGPFAAEFHKITLVVRESLKRISATLQPLAQAWGFRIPHWPSSGLYLRLETPSPLDAKRLQARLRAMGIEVLTGDEQGDASAVRLCYAMHLSQCDRLLKRLRELS